MDWKIEFSKDAMDDFNRLDKAVQIRLGKFLDRIISQPNPRKLGKALTGILGLYWCYRMGDYRIICTIQDNILTVELVRIGHRSEIYKMLNKIMKMKKNK
ncbi:MAG: type II toxin-antitoxin system RelE/ParE family toxin [Synergistaceae bacterium]|nr:type II toxin-antitoxin system RelE/ParE family toxin [Synergistaceae bacterium]MBQ4419189.1 type II toxin-antitoxin system RelE/ParE family toxin [Synergistaceae bacterium]MBQ6740365.1 type II toxin-antitoxin system RelE/ParE family toxin [Synergistaceae bacterium]MBQ6909991.1 type II toxin-antitoxin system RelE/ParE family toxin [Synergistaceae bacterium]MBQ7569337.1 type II toxin-antitoxin system RelE/ParE family toxin [Synergistaceae bacterium]